MKSFVRFGYVSILWTYLVIFLGGLVRVSGAGLGCPDWPKCFGRWIPPTSVSQLPADINPDTFNFALAWIEYINRLAGFLLGIIIVITAILAIRYYRKIPSVTIPAVLAALLVAYQGWQGGQVIASELKPILVSVHMGIAFLIVSLLIIATVRAYLMQNRGLGWQESPPRRIKTWLAVIGGMTLIQVAVGTRIRGGIEMTAEKYPLLSADQWLGMVRGYSDAHYFFGALLLIGSLIVVPRVLRLNTGNSPLISQTAWGMLIMIVIQLLVGLSMIFFDMPPIMQLVHLWVSSLFIGMTLTLYATFHIPREE